MSDENKAAFPQRYGKYELLEKIGEGGMAEVFRARLPGAAGFEKILVVKRILPHLANKPDFVTMFVDEAKLAAKIQHQNAVQVFELGEVEGGELYMAMEYVSGVDLRRLLVNARNRKLRIPVWFVLHTMVEVLNGLAYAHELIDGDGNPLHVVHRDVTPGNIFVSFQGEVKLADFGIAKAVGRVSETEAGQVKGNAPFMSPEAIYGRVLDARADVFSAGVVLWTSLALRLPFEGGSNYETAKKVCEAKREAPSRYNPLVPPELDAVALDALEIQRERRIGSAREFQARLLEILSKVRPRLLPSDVRHVVDVLSGRKPPDAQFMEESTFPAPPAPVVDVARSELSGERFEIPWVVTTPPRADAAPPRGVIEGRRELIGDLAEPADAEQRRIASHPPSAVVPGGPAVPAMVPSASRPHVPAIGAPPVLAESWPPAESWPTPGYRQAMTSRTPPPRILRGLESDAPPMPGMVPTAPFVFSGAQPPAQTMGSPVAPPPARPRTTADGNAEQDPMVLRDVPLASIMDYMPTEAAPMVEVSRSSERYYSDSNPFHIRFEDGSVLTATGFDECLRFCDPHGRRANAVSVDRDNWLDLQTFARLCGLDYLTPDTTPLKKVKLVGVLEERSLASVFGHLSKHRLTGRLVVMDKGVSRVARREIDVIHGAPVFVYADHLGLQFPQLYVLHDLVKRDLMPELVVQAIRQRQTLEDVMRQKAFIDLNQYRPVLMKDRLAELFTWRYGRYAFDAGRESRGTTQFAPSLIRTLPDAVQRGYTETELRKVMEPYMSLKLRRSESFDAQLQDLGLKGPQLAAARRLGQRALLGQLVKKYANEAHVQLAMAFVLVELETLAVG